MISSDLPVPIVRYSAFLSAHCPPLALSNALPLLADNIPTITKTLYTFYLPSSEKAYYIHWIIRILRTMKFGFHIIIAQCSSSERQILSMSSQ